MSIKHVKKFAVNEASCVSLLICASIVTACDNRISKRDVSGKGSLGTYTQNTCSTSMDPFPVLSKNAQSLKYPPGADTLAYWGNGRFSIILNNLFDMEAKGPKCIFKGVHRFRQEGEFVFCRGKEDYLVVNLSTGGVSRFVAQDAAGKDIQKGLTRLLDDSETNNFIIDQELLRIQRQNMNKGRK